VACHLGDLARHPRLDLVGTDARPQARKAVPEVEDVGDERGRGVRGHPENSAELGGSELGNLRCARAAELNELLSARQGDAPGGSVEAAVQVGPLCGQGENVDLVLVGRPARGLGGCERLVGTQFAELSAALGRRTRRIHHEITLSGNADKR
jgi:hypothetical protein